MAIPIRLSTLRAMGNEIVESVRASHRGLVDAVRAMTDDQASAPSLLPGWTRGILVAHVISAGHAALRCAEAASAGTSVAMYPGGEEQRDAEIESGRTRTAADLASGLAQVCTACDAAFAALTGEAWDLMMGSRRGPIPMRAVAVQRWIDVEAHHVDLDLGYHTSDWSDEFVDATLPTALNALLFLRQRPDADRETVGARRVRRLDGLGDWTIHADGERGWIDDAETSDCTIEGPGRALLALVIGREPNDPLTSTGNETLARDLKRAFPGP